MYHHWLNFFKIFSPMFEHPTKFDDAICFSRFDTEHWLSPASPHPIELDGRNWQTAEHYYQANKYAGSYSERIANCESPLLAYKLGNRWFKPKRADFAKVRPVLMTRALYIKARTYPPLRELLASTEGRLIAELSQFGHYWGIGRDQRGRNQLGRIWMEIRTKLEEVL